MAYEPIATTSESEELPSSTPTAPSKPWRDIARLGHLIVDELELKNSNGVLGRWMAHRVAELMHRAEIVTDPAIKEAAEQESQDLIIRLWEMRDFWPRGGPLAPLLPTLHQLLDQQGYPMVRFTGRPEPNDTSGLLAQLMRLHRREMRELCEMIAANLPSETVEPMQQLINEHLEDLSDDELNLLEISITPASFAPFREDEAEELEGESYPEEPMQTPMTDKFADFKEKGAVAREKLYAKISQLLADSGSAE